MGEKLGWHRSIETAKPQQLLRPCFEQRVGPDGLHIVPAVKCLPRVKPNPDLSRQHQSWREECWRQSHGHPGGTAGKGMLHCNPSQEEVAPPPSGAVGSRNSRGWGWPDLISPLCFLPREAQQVLKASTNGGEKKRSCQGAVAQGTAHPQQDMGPGDDILAGDQGVLLLKWRQKWQGLQHGLLDLNHTLSTPCSRRTTRRAPDIWHSWAAAPQPGGSPAPRPTGYRSPAALSRKWEIGKTTIIIIKKDVNDPAPCPVAPGHPREQGILQSEGKWRHRDFPANAGSRLYCTLHHIYFYVYIYKNTN